MLSPKPVNYEYNLATISNNYYCRLHQSIMNIIEPQFQTIYQCRLSQSIMNIVQPQFQTINTVAQTSQLWI